VKKLKWYYGLCAFVVTLLLIGAGYVYYEKIFNEIPFKESLVEVDKVEEVELQDEGDKIKIVVTALYHPDFSEVVKNVGEIAENELDQEFIVMVKDQPDEKLSSFNDEITPAIYEGVRLGNYREIESYISERAEGYSFDHYRFSVDNRHIYVQAESGDSYLYILVPIDYNKGGSK